MSAQIVSTELDKSSHTISKMFDRIATRYDLLNHLLSCGVDIYWRQQVAKRLPDVLDLKILDVATGTADLAIALQKHRPYANIFGVDMAEKMLAIGRQKILNRKMELDLAVGDAQSLVFADKIFDVTTIGFGIRNVTDPALALSEMFRVTKPLGKILVLEFSMPQSSAMASAYLWYFRKVLPKLGSAISGDSGAYSYLKNSVEDFPCGEKFMEKMRVAGFENITATSMTLGTVTLYEGTRPEGDFFDD